MPVNIFDIGKGIKRIDEKEFNKNKLGFGLMRLPKKGLGIDVEQTKQMVDLFMESGLTYYDIYCSDIEKRLNNIMEKENISEAEARRLMEKRIRTEVITSSIVQAKGNNYDVEINTSELTVEECANVLAEIL